MAADLTIPNNFVAGAPSVADDVDANFNAVANWVNANAVHLDGSKAFTNVPSGPATDPTSANQLTRKAYVDSRYTICTSITRPATPIEGQLIYETDTNRHWRYSGTVWVFMGGTGPRVDVRRNSAFSIPNGVITPLQFNLEIADPDNMWVVGTPTRVTIPAGMGGLYLVNWSLQFGANGVGAGDRQAYVTANGVGTRFAQTFVPMPNTIAGCSISGSCVLALNAGDYVELQVFQNSSAALNVYPNASANDGMFQVTWIGASS